MVAAAKLLRHVGRKRSGLFLAEGSNLVGAALSRRLVTDVFATKAALDRFGDLLRPTPANVPVHVVTEKAAKTLSDTVSHVGLFAVCTIPHVALTDVLNAAPQLVLVTVETSEPGNAGTLIRIADAMGADAVILAGESVDPYNGKCLRASAGSIFAVPILSAPDPAALIATLRFSGLRVLATTLDGEVSLDDPEVLTQLAARTAWLFGAEAHGLSEEVARLADARVVIPMPGSAESLNIAAAAAICLYQSSRANRSGAPAPRA